VSGVTVEDFINTILGPKFEIVSTNLNINKQIMNLGRPWLPKSV